MTSRILISGCSYTDGRTWPNKIWPTSTIYNLARSGSSNRYISDSIIQSIDLCNKPDFVFILWTGLNKLDLIVPVSPLTTKLANNHKFYGKLNNSFYLFDGGDKYNLVLEQSYNKIKDKSWPPVKNLHDFFCATEDIKIECINNGIFSFKKVDSLNLDHYLQLGFMLMRLYHDNKFFNDISLSAIANCSEFLEYHNIPYRFSFFCDVFSDHSKLLQGQIDKTNSNFSRICWEKYVKLTPYEFGLKYDLISKDNFHLTDSGMNEWAKKVNFLIRN